jgi:hypothetical protein
MQLPSVNNPHGSLYKFRNRKRLGKNGRKYSRAFVVSPGAPGRKVLACSGIIITRIEIIIVSRNAWYRISIWALDLPCKRRVLRVALALGKTHVPSGIWNYNYINNTSVPITQNANGCWCYCIISNGLGGGSTELRTGTGMS